MTSCEISSSQLHPRRPRGTFKCECGFVYSRVGPDRLPADRYKLDRYVNFGEVWENAVREGLEKREPYTTICQQLRISRNTLLKQLGRMGLKGARGRRGPLPRNNRRRSQRQIHSADHRHVSPQVWAQRRARNRRGFLRCRKANPDLSRTQLRLKCPAAYSWLYTNDRVWQVQHLPDCHASQRKKDSLWSEKDAALAIAVQLEADKIRALPGRPVIVSATKIAHKLEIAHVWSKRNEVIPLTCETLREISETAEQFAVRRIKWAAEQFQEQGVSATSWRIAFLAGVSGKTGKKPAVRAALDTAVERLKAQMDLTYSQVGVA